MRIAVVGDLHIDPTNIKDSKIGMKELVRTLDDQAVDILMIAGDVFCNFNICGRDVSFGSVFNTVLTPLKDFLSQDQKRRILMIPGNHDMSTRKDQKDALYGFEYQDRITVSHNIEPFYITRGLLVVTLPWMYPGMYESKEVLLSKLEELASVQATQTPLIKMLLGHCEVEGAEVPSGYTVLGGHFKFTLGELNSLGFDEIFLGHIHKKQLYYLGSPWQHSFGEEGIQGTIEILELTNCTFNREVVEISRTPKYFTIKPEDVDSIRVKAHDHVKVRGKICPSLPSKNFIFEKEIDKKEFRTRSDVSTGDNVEVLLDKWVKLNEKDVEVPLEELTKTLLSLDIPKDYAYKGSLEKIDYLKLINIGPHHDTSLTFPVEDSILAIAGANGSGKSVFIESVIAALYGEYPSYGHIDELVPKGEKGEIEMSFVSKGKRHRILRSVSSSHTVYLFNDKNEILVGPKVTEVKKYIETLVGPKELLLASIFSSQSFEGDITEIDPSDRKQVFSKLLGSMHLDEVYCKVDVEFQDIKAQITRNQTLIDNVDLNEMLERVKLADKTLKENEGHLKIIENELIVLRKEKVGNTQTNLNLLEDIGKYKENQGINKKIEEQKLVQKEFEDLKEGVSLLNTNLEDKKKEKLQIADSLNERIKVLLAKEQLLGKAGCKSNLLPCSFIDDAKEAPKLISTLTANKDTQFIGINKEIKAAEKVLENTTERMEIHKGKTDKLTEELISLTSNNKELNELQQSLTESAKSIDDLVNLMTLKENKCSEFKTEIIKEKKELFFCQRTLGQLEGLMSTQAALEIDYVKYNILRSAFSKDGIPQLIIDAALPQFQEILNILSSYIKRFSIEVTTQKELKSGGAKETIGFLVDDGVKKRDIKYFSGGERKLLKGFIRIGMSLFQSQRTGGRYSVLFLDEAFDSLDRDRAMLLMKIINNLSEIFTQIFVVSHTNDLLGQFGKVITFENRNDKTEVISN